MNSLEDILEEVRLKSKPDAQPELLLEKQSVRKIDELGGKYMLRVTPISFGKGYWSYSAVEIYLVNPDGIGDDRYQKVGQYLRNYSSMYRTFHPFIKNGKEYALYSKDYTATRVMRLPDCVDIAGEEANGFGFCPTDFYVPQPGDVVKEEGDEPNACLDGSFGFVSGCHWGDDSSWKIEFLDLSRIDDGILTREARFGYIELPDDRSLKDAIGRLDYFDSDHRWISIRTTHSFDIDKKVDVVFSSIVYDEYEKQLRQERPELFKKCKSCNHPGRYHGNSCPYSTPDPEGKYSRCNCKIFEPGTETATDDEV